MDRIAMKKAIAQRIKTIDQHFDPKSRPQLDKELEDLINKRDQYINSKLPNK